MDVESNISTANGKCRIANGKHIAARWRRVKRVRRFSFARSAGFRCNRLPLLNDKNKTTQVEFYAFWYNFRYIDVPLVARRNSRVTHNVEAFAFNAANFISRFIRDHPATTRGSLKSALASGQREIRGRISVVSNCARGVHIRKQRICVDIAESYEKFYTSIRITANRFLIDLCSYVYEYGYRTSL